MKLILSVFVAALSLYAQATAPAPSCAAPTQQNCQAPSLDQGVLSSAQVATSPNHASAFASVIPSTVQLTDAIYWASKPQAVQALNMLQGLPPGQPAPGQPLVTGNPRYQGCMQLQTQGYQIDVWIDCLGNDPVVTMLLRSEMNIASTPTLPSGSVKTSLAPADYPAFYPPAPVTPANAVGNFQYDDGTYRHYGAGAAALPDVAAGLIQNNALFVESGISYTAHISFGLTGESVNFTVPD